MLFVSLGFSLFLLVLANLAVRRSPHPCMSLLLYVPLGVFVPEIVLATSLPAAALQSVLMPFVYGVWRWGRWPHGTFAALSIAAAVLAYPCWGLLQLHRDGPERARLREHYPYESMEARVPPVRPTSRPVALPAIAASRLTELEQAVQGLSNGIREEALRAMHEYSVREFLDSPGFGLLSLPALPTRYTLPCGTARNAQAAPLGMNPLPSKRSQP